MKFKFLFLPLIAIGCASVHPGNMGEALSAKKQIDISVSGKSPEKDFNSPFQMIEVTVENNTAEWVRISRTEVVIDDPAKSKVSVVVGNDLESWVEAKNNEDSLRRHNEDMAALGVIAAGSAVAIAGAKNGNSNMTTAGLGTALATSGAMSGKELVNAKNRVESPQKVPSSHLYHPFSIPGKMFMRKWLLINKPVGVLVNNLVLEFETVEGKKERYAIKI